MEQYGRRRKGLEKSYWRREWDSNPRYSRPYSGFQDRRLRPLGHPSWFNSISISHRLSPFHSLTVLALSFRRDGINIALG